MCRAMRRPHVGAHRVLWGRLSVTAPSQRRWQRPQLCAPRGAAHSLPTRPLPGPAAVLQVVKVFVSVYSDDYGKRVAMENLQRLEP